MLVKNWVRDHIVLIDDGVQTLKIWWEKSLQGRSTENHSSHFDVLGLEYLERAQPEDFRRDIVNTVQVLRLIKEELGLFSKALGKLELPS
jgi:hypothetical protein